MPRPTSAFLRKTAWPRRLGVAAIAAILMVGVLGVAASPAAYVPTNLDPLFGNGGVIVSPASAGEIVTKHNLLADSEGSPVGVFRTLRPSPECGYDVRLDRFAADDGSLVGSSALAAGAPCPAAVPGAMAIGSDGAGHYYVATGSGFSLRLTRLLADGTVDLSYGQAGTVVFATPQRVAPDLLKAWAGGEVLIAGMAVQAPGVPADTFLARIMPDGNPNPGFRGGGLSFFDTGLGESAPEPSALEVAPNGDIYLAGPLSPATAGHQWSPAGIRAFTLDGQPDPRYGRGGFVKLPGNEAPAMTTIGGELVVAVGGESGTARVLRLNRGGRLDRHFGHGGVVSLKTRSEFQIAELAKDARARIVLAGTTGCCITGQPKEFAVRRLEREGGVDRSFAGGHLFYLRAPRAGPRQAIAVEGLLVGSGNAGRGITVSGSIGRIGNPCTPTCPQASSTDVRFRLKG
jgi:uncharacterized delta-60 repeat protein